MLVLILLAGSYFLSRELYFGIATLATVWFVATGTPRITREIGILIGLLFALIMIAVFGTLVTAIGEVPSTTAMVRDVWYMLRAPLYLVMGYLLYQWWPDQRQLLWLIVAGGLLIALSYAAKFVLDPSLFNASRQYIRDEVGRGAMLLPISMALLLAGKPSRQQLWTTLSWLRFPAVLLFGMVIILTGSRSYWLLLALLCAAFAGLFRSRAVIWYAALPVLLVTLLVGTPLWQAFFTPSQYPSVLAVTPSVFQEALVYPHQGIGHINENWRGYEAHRTFRQYLAGGTGTLLVGEGLGAAVDLGIHMRLSTGADSKLFREVTLLHNGYAYVAIKTGLLGLIVYNCILLTLVGYSHSIPERARTKRVEYISPKKWHVDQGISLKTQQFWASLLAAIGIMQIYNSMAINGLFNADEAGVTLLLLSGVAIAVLRQPLIPNHG